MEKEAPSRKPLFYKRFVADIITRRKKDAPDELYQFLYKYHPNIKLTCEITPEKLIQRSSPLTTR